MVPSLQRDYTTAVKNAIRRTDTLVMHVAEDRNARLEEGKAINMNLGGEKELVVFTGAGHVSLCGASPHLWKDVVGQFLARQVETIRP